MAFFAALDIKALVLYSKKKTLYERNFLNVSLSINEFFFVGAVFLFFKSLFSEFFFKKLCAKIGNFLQSLPYNPPGLYLS